VIGVVPQDAGAVSGSAIFPVRNEGDVWLGLGGCAGAVVHMRWFFITVTVVAHAHAHEGNRRVSDGVSDGVSEGVGASKIGKASNSAA
jgi:hypothetical protein